MLQFDVSVAAGMNGKPSSAGIIGIRRMGCRTYGLLWRCGTEFVNGECTAGKKTVSLNNPPSKVVRRATVVTVFICTVL